MTDEINQNRVGLAQSIAGRLCHDISGPVGALDGVLDLLNEGDPAMLALAREQAAALRGRLALFRAAWGPPAGRLDAAALALLLAGSPTANRTAFRLDRLDADSSLPGFLVPLAVNAALLAAEALPRRGTVHLAGNPLEGLLVWPEGPRAAWPAGLLGLLAGDPWEAAVAAGPRHVLAPFLLALAAATGWRAELQLSTGRGPAALMLSPRSPAAIC